MQNKTGESNWLYKIILLPVFVLAGVFILSASAQELDITGNIVWTKAQSPIVVSERVWVKSGGSLIIEPGVVVKFYPNQFIIAAGIFNAIGTEAEPIVFTSIKDDEHGGDTNGDGSASQPQPGDWYRLSSQSNTFKYILVQYGGVFHSDGIAYNSAVIDTYRGNLNIANAIITNNGGGISNYESQLNITNSSIYNNLSPFDNMFFDIGIDNNNRANITVNAVNNWWGSAEGPCPWRTLLGTGTRPTGEKIKAVCGDKPLVDVGVVYSPWLLSDPFQPAVNPVIIVPGIMGSWFSNENGWQLDPILDTYDNLYKALVENGGYVPEETLFKFPYEWRQDNALSAYQLKQKIDEVKNLTGADKVDIIAHSMGGLVARYYIESDNYENDIDQAVFLGTPHKGSPKSYLTWEGADGFDTFKEKIMKLYFTQEAHARGYATLFDYIQNYVKSTEQLLPDYGYLKDAGQTSFRIYDKINYPNNYPYNIFLENLNAEENLSKFAASGVKILNIIGDTGDNTIGVIELSPGESYWPMWKHGYAEKSIKLTGDNTVPEISSSLFIPTKISGADHLSLPTKAQNQVIEYLTGQTPAYEITETPEPKEVLVISVYSPVDFAVISPSGKKLGKDFFNNDNINEMANAFYSGFESETEFAVIVNPEDGEYKVEIQGTGEGEYKLNVDYVEENFAAGQSFIGNIISEQAHNFDFDLDKEAEDSISDLEPEDNIPPTITINSPAPGEQYSHNENLIIDYMVVDDFSGIASATATLNGRILATTTVNLFDYNLGASILKIIAADNAGNIRETYLEFKIIANIDSAVSDIKIIYNNGWITDKNSGNSLINGLNHFKKKLKRIDDQINKIKEEIEKIINNQKPECKEKKARELNKKLEKLAREREEIIKHYLNKLTEELDKIKTKNRINGEGYDIILNNFNYLRENL